jgi:hypothetical protein
VYRKPGPCKMVDHSLQDPDVVYEDRYPSDVLRLLVLYIQRIYGKVWFQLKQEKSFTKSPSILFDIIQEGKSFDKDGGSISEIVFPVFERNAFACLGENFLESRIKIYFPKSIQCTLLIIA